MDIRIYCTPDGAPEARALADRLRGELSRTGADLQVEPIADAGIGVQNLPMTVVRVMAVKGAETFPLTLVGGHAARSGSLPDPAELRTWAADGLSESLPLVTEAVSAGDTRVHISLDVTDIETSLPFYMVLFNARPTKRREDYVKFELAEPRLDITLNQHDDSHASSGYYGIQVKTSTAVRQATERLSAAGFATTEEAQTACCYPVQSKIRVVDPDGNRWEVFLLTEAKADEGRGADCVRHADLEHRVVSPVTAATAIAN